jgi:hypothetical protein
VDEMVIVDLCDRLMRLEDEQAKQLGSYFAGHTQAPVAFHEHVR